MKKKLVELEKLIVRTPLIPFEMQNLVSKTRIYLKPENLQLFGSYKIRGVVSAIKESEPRQLLLGVAAASAGNLAQAVAFAALKLGIPCKIFIPESAPPIKKQMVRRLGAELVELPYQKVWEIVRGGIVLPHAGLFIHPALTEGLIKGYKKIAQEIMEDLPDTEAVIIPFGVGGLSLGIARALHQLRPGVAIFTCEPETAAPLNASLKAGKAIAVRRSPSFVDAIGTPEVLPQVFQSLSPLIRGSLVVSLNEIREGMKILLFNHKLVCEGAAACAFAAAMQLCETHNYQKIVCILTGGNIFSDVLREIVG